MELSQETNKNCGGRPTSKITVFFGYNSELNKATCKVPGCTYCCITHTGNQTRHMASVHPDLYRKFLREQEKHITDQSPVEEERKEKEIQQLNRVNLSRSTIKRAILELVTVNGRPFSILEDSGMRKILQPILDRLPPNEKLNTSPESVKLYIYDESDRIIKIIEREVQEKKFISLKVDVASRHGRSFLGLNVQFIQDGKISVRTLGVVELTDRHTSEYLKDEILKVFKKYNINIGNIYSFTSDNAANMLKLHSLLEIHEDCEGHELDDDTTDDIDNEDYENMSSDNVDTLEGAGNEIDEDELKEQDMLQSLKNIFENENSSKIINVRCAAHTLQLAIEDGIKMSNVGHLIAKARQAVKYFRKDGIINSLKKLRPNLSRPVLDTKTRWHSTHDMLASLLSFKDFTTQTKYLNDRDWQDISTYVKVLEPAKIAAKTFQNEQLIMPEFFSAWLVCKEAIQNINIPFSQNIVKCMERREEKILKNVSLLGGLFLDPLLNCILNEGQRTEAVNHLADVWIKLQNFHLSVTEEGRKNDSMDISEDGEDSTGNEKISNMAACIKEALHKKKKAKIDKPYMLDIKPMLQSFYENQGIRDKETLLEFWEANKFVYPELYKLAVIVLATPATQVSVERLFSGLKYIFSDLRGKLNTNILNSIMIIRTNYKNLCMEEKTVHTKKQSKKHKTVKTNSVGTSSENSNTSDE